MAMYYKHPATGEWVKQAGGGGGGGAGSRNTAQKYVSDRNTYIMPVPHGYCESKLTYTDLGAKVTDAFKSNEKLAAIMQNFSDLATAHPDYVTETLLGKDASGTYNIYKYEMDFHPAVDSGYASVMRYDKPVFIITAGLHGIEPDAVFEVYHFMKDLCENYFESEHLEYLRTNVKFVVVPISNPWGFVNGTYNNSNNINLNKNFEHGFAPVTGATNTQLNSGTAPYTEAEAVLLKGVFDEYSDAVFHLECHGKAAVDNAYSDVIWFSLMESLSSEFIELCANTLVNQIGRRLYKLGYNKEKTEGGYITYYTLGGRPKDYTGTEYGMLSCTMEGTGRMGVAGHTTFGADEQRINCEALTNFVLRVLDSLSSMAGDIVLVGDASTVNNPKNYIVTNNLTNVSTSNAVSRVFAGNSYSATLTAVDGYELSTCNVTMNGSAVAVTNGVINIPSITGDIVVTASATKIVVRYSVTKNLSNCTISNSATTAVEGEPYTATITAKDGYDLSSVTVTMGGTPVSVSNGLINIAKVTGNIVITATATERPPEVITRSITTNLTNCTISNGATTVVDGASYAATITPNAGYVLGNVSVTMGGSAVTVTNGVINIASVTGNIVITANAVVDTSNLLPSADTSTLISGDLTTATKYTGYFGGVRLNSSGLMKSAPGHYSTGFIPYTYQGTGDRIKIKNTAWITTSYTLELCFYDSSHKFLGYGGYGVNDGASNSFADCVAHKDNGLNGKRWTQESDGQYMITWTPSGMTNISNGTIDTSKIAYIRICMGDFANATIAITH